MQQQHQQQQQQQQQQQAQMQPQARPPWVPPPVVIIPPFSPLPAAPAHQHMPRPGVPGFAPPHAPGFGPPQGWSGARRSPTTTVAGRVPARSLACAAWGPQQQEGGGQGGPGDPNGNAQRR